MFAHSKDIIIALSTPVGEGAIGVIRLSGKGCIELVDTFFQGKNLKKVDGNTVHYGKISNEEGRMIDECVATIFRNPRSYTKEDVVEISCHGSSYIIDQIIQLCLRNGARLAQRGEFTLRAFLNGQLDLSQAEAVADLIASDSQASHELALKQMRGGFSKQIKELRQELIDFAALIELELDFSEEDVEFADRKKLEDLVSKINDVIQKLLSSFTYGNAIKKGIAVAIVGKPNVGKSTLLNALLNEERAIVSSIAGTTRDTIEDTLVIDGILFRFIDTAGIRNTKDEIESIGISKTLEQLEKANIVLFLEEINTPHKEIADAFNNLQVRSNQKAIILINKLDLMNSCSAFDIEEATSTLTSKTPTIAFSAKDKLRIEDIKKELISSIQSFNPNEDIVVSNIRHYDALLKSRNSLDAVLSGLKNGLTGDFIAMDIRQSLHHLGEITGEISTDDLLDSIFTRFCIGK